MKSNNALLAVATELDNSCPIASFITNENGLFISFENEVPNSFFGLKCSGYYYDIIDEIENIRMNGDQLDGANWKNTFDSKCSIEVFDFCEKIYCIYKEKGFYFVFESL